MKPRWYWHRLAKMSPLEMILRGRQHLRQQRDLRIHQHRPPRPAAVTDTKPRRPPVPEPAELARQFPRWESDAGPVPAPGWGTLPLFRLGPWTVSPEVDWHRDYLSGRSVPAEPAWRIPFRDPRVVGNIKYIWEINRLQFLLPLAFRGFMTGRRDVADAVKACIGQWRAANPLLRGVNWTSALEAGIRLVSFFWIYLFIGPLLEEDDGFMRGFRQCLFEHCWFIRRHHAFGSSANNHLIGELAGVYLIGRLLPFAPEMAGYADWAGRALRRAARRQIAADGVNREQAIAYHCFSLDFLLLAGWMGEAAGDPFPAEYWERLRRGVAFLHDIADGAGNYPAYGDSDSGRAWWWGDDDARCVGNYRSLVIGSGPPWLQAREPCLKWALLGASATAAPPCPQPGLQTARYPDGGFLIVRSATGGQAPDLHLVFFGNPLGLPPLNAHGHADALSVCLSLDGEAFLIDPGTYAYHLHPEWRDYFRSTAAHNVVHCPDAEPVRWQGPFQARSRYRAELRLLRREDDCVCAQATRSHGRRRFRWTRDLHVFAADGVVGLRDRLREPPGVAYRHFHLADGCQADVLADGRIVEIRRHAFCYLVSPDPPGWRLSAGELQPRRGWLSPGFDRLQPGVTAWAGMLDAADTFLVTSRERLTADEILQRCRDIGARFDNAVTG